MSRRLFIEFTCDQCGLVELKPAEKDDWLPLRMPAPADWRRLVRAQTGIDSPVGELCPKCAEPAK